jgi:hypothetical protein
MYARWPSVIGSGVPCGTSWVIFPTCHIPGLLKHKTRVALLFIVDDFVVKYLGEENAHHLKNALMLKYEITRDLGGILYSGITLKW